jgi:hypothetical protein
MTADYAKQRSLQQWDIEPQSLTIAERDYLKKARELKRQRDLLKTVGRGF